MSIWPTTIKKIDSGKNLLIKFENNDEFRVSAELLRVECPSADVQGHGGPKIIVRNKSDVVINSIEQIGNYAIRIIFSDDHSSAFLVGIYCMIMEKTMICISISIINP